MGFIIGLFIGGFIGVAVMCCLFVAKEADKEIYKNKNKEKHNG
jgi:gas vesicle protein